MKNIELAEIMLSVTPARPPAEVQYELGKNCQERELNDKARDWYEHSIKKDYPYAKASLADWYRDGCEGVIEIDLSKSEQMFYEAGWGFKKMNEACKFQDLDLIQRMEDARKSQQEVRRQKDEIFCREKSALISLARFVIGAIVIGIAFKFPDTFFVGFMVALLLKQIVWTIVRLRTFVQYQFGKFKF